MRRTSRIDLRGKEYMKMSNRERHGWEEKRREKTRDKEGN